MTSKLSIIVAPSDDIHAFAVKRAALAMGQEVVIIDSESFLAENCFSFKNIGRGSELSFKLQGLSENRPLSGLWWRRPRAPKFSGSPKIHPGLEGYLEREATHALYGALLAGFPNSFNDMGASKQASRKPLQLHHADALGLRIPRSIVTNDPQEATAFFHELDGNVVYKLLNGTDLGFFETRRLQKSDLTELWRASICPIMLQEQIFGIYDLRVTIVGDDVFCARIDYDLESEIIDSRFTTKSLSKFALGHDISEKLLSIMRRFGLIYGAIDLRVSNDGSITFFELNPEGQYLWTEIEAGLPISEAIAGRLSGVR